jgi:hypothetical protein
LRETRPTTWHSACRQTREISRRDSLRMLRVCACALPRSLLRANCSGTQSEAAQSTGTVGRGLDSIERKHALAGPSFRREESREDQRPQLHHETNALKDFRGSKRRERERAFATLCSPAVNQVALSALRLSGCVETPSVLGLWSISSERACAQGRCATAGPVGQALLVPMREVHTRKSSFTPTPDLLMPTRPRATTKKISVH